MKGTLSTLGVFVLGCIAGWSGLVDLDRLGKAGENASMIVLFILMFLVGISMGHNPDLKKILKGIRPGIVLLPLVSIFGTLLFSALASLLIPARDMTDCLAIGSGMGYYSLSSVLIARFKEVSVGAQLAAELGTVALLTNIFREIFTLIGTPLLGRWFGPFAPVASAGATAFDVCMPMIIRYGGNRILPYAIVSGVLTDFSVPFLVSFFCSF